jgi:FlaA1/EpsC-like NDP-sugar epimerase
MPKKPRLVVLALLVIDILAVGTAVGLSFGIEQRWGLWPESTPAPLRSTLVFAALTLVTVIAFFAANRVYDLDLTFAGHREYAGVFRGAGSAGTLVLIVAFLAGQPVSRGAIPLACLFVIAFTGSASFLFRRFIFRLRESGHFVNRWLLIGADEHAAAVALQLNAPRATGIRSSASSMITSHRLSLSTTCAFSVTRAWCGRS